LDGDRRSMVAHSSAKAPACRQNSGRPFETAVDNKVCGGGGRTGHDESADQCARNCIVSHRVIPFETAEGQSSPRQFDRHDNHVLPFNPGPESPGVYVSRRNGASLHPIGLDVAKISRSRHANPTPPTSPRRELAIVLRPGNAIQQYGQLGLTVGTRFGKNRLEVHTRRLT
jgi:hypothetical protein